MSFNADAYHHWANCGVGSSVTAEDVAVHTADLGAPMGTLTIRNVTITKTTLIARDASKATVEIHVAGAANGAPFEMKNTVDLPAGPAAEPDQPRSERGGDADEGWEVTMMTDEQLFKGATPKESEETLEVAGRQVACRRIERSTMLHGAPFSTTVWTSDQVPGGVVQMEATMGNQVTKTRVTAFEKK
jgi:hypothetical protein